jgi:hypothetical protein
MTIVQTINKGVKILLFPGFMNSLYRHFGGQGNMGLAGVYMDVINKRNCVYFMGASTIFFSFFSTKYVLCGEVLHATTFRSHSFIVTDHYAYSGNSYHIYGKVSGSAFQWLGIQGRGGDRTLSFQCFSDQ